MYANTATETGTGNAGSNWTLESVADDGSTILGNPITVIRSSGNVFMPFPVNLGDASNAGQILMAGPAGTSRIWRMTTAGSA